MSCGPRRMSSPGSPRSEEHTSELQSQFHLVCRLLLEKKKLTLSTTGGNTNLLNNRDATSALAGDMTLYVNNSYCSLTDATLARIQDAVVFFFNDTATTEIYTLALHDALPI